MDRRELLKMVATLTGGIVIGGEVFLSGGCRTNDTSISNGFNESDIEFLDEVAETILPKTNTPGAKDAAVGQFMTIMVNDCYGPTDQEVFHKGINQLDEASKNAYKEKFLKLTPEQRHDLLVTLDKESKEYQKKKSAFDNDQNDKLKKAIASGNKDFKKETMPTHYFIMLKQLTLLGFFTSQPGATQALRYIAVPGKYEGCIPYTKGEKAWAT